MPVHPRCSRDHGTSLGVGLSTSQLRPCSCRRLLRHPSRPAAPTRRVEPSLSPRWRPASGRRRRALKPRISQAPGRPQPTAPPPPERCAPRYIHACRECVSCASTASSSTTVHARLEMQLRPAVLHPHVPWPGAHTVYLRPRACMHGPGDAPLVARLVKLDMLRSGTRTAVLSASRSAPVDAGRHCCVCVMGVLSKKNPGRVCARCTVECIMAALWGMMTSEHACRPTCPSRPGATRRAVATFRDGCGRI